MSTWQHIPIEDVEVSEDTVDILVNTDQHGNNYITIDKEKLLELLKEQDNGKRD